MFLSEFETRELLRKHKIDTGPYVLVKNVEEIERRRDDFSFPIAMKIVSKDILHKTEAKGVILNIQSINEAKESFHVLLSNAYSYNSNADIDGVIITPMVQNGVEVIIGAKKDEQFGPVVMFGLGGISVELFKDVVFRLAPVNFSEATEMIKSIKAFQLLDGFRGREKANICLLAKLIHQVSCLIHKDEKLMELELNPVNCGPTECTILDALASIRIE